MRPDKFLEIEVRNIDEFKEALSLKPNMITYVVLISACERVNNHHEALELWDGM